MPYDIRKIDDKFCVVKRSDGKRMGCHDTRAEAVRQLSAIEASEGNKASVFKYADGGRYMLIVTSNSYQDREKEWITADALKTFVNDQWDGEQFAGNNDLLFWHDGPPIGKAVFADMEGPFLFEVFQERSSGLPMVDIYAKAIWNYIEVNPDLDWGASHGFQYDPAQTERGADGLTYRAIHKFETSVLPREYAANSLTYSGVVTMSDKARDEALEKIVPGFGERIRRALGLASGELDAAGAEHKALKAKMETTLTRDDLLDLVVYTTKSVIETATKADDDQTVDVRDAAGEALDALLEVPTVDVAIAEEILQVEDDEPATEDAEAGHDHQHSEPEEPGELEKALASLVAFNDELIENQKALSEGLGTLPDLVKAVADLPAQVAELREAMKAMQAEFKQRPRASRSADTVIGDDHPLAEKAAADNNDGDPFFKGLHRQS